MKKDLRLVQCTVNGKEVAEYVDVRESLLDMLRNHLGLTSVKKGCEVGECGAGNVIVDGETIDSCTIWLCGQKEKISVHWKGLKKTESLQEFRKLLLRKALFSADFVRRDL